MAMLTVIAAVARASTAASSVRRRSARRRAGRADLPASHPQREVGRGRRCTSSSPEPRTPRLRRDESGELRSAGLGLGRPRLTLESIERPPRSWSRWASATRPRLERAAAQGTHGVAGGGQLSTTSRRTSGRTTVRTPAAVARAAVHQKSIVAPFARDRTRGLRRPQPWAATTTASRPVEPIAQATPGRRLHRHVFIAASRCPPVHPTLGGPRRSAEPVRCRRPSRTGIGDGGRARSGGLGDRRDGGWVPGHLLHRVARAEPAGRDRADHHVVHGEQQDHQIERDRPVAQVEQVEPPVRPERRVVARLELPRAR